MYKPKHQRRDPLHLAAYDDRLQRENHSEPSPLPIIEQFSEMQIIDVIPITDSDKLLKIPDTPEYILGLFYHKDNLIPILDTGINYGEHIIQHNESCFIAILKVQETMVGFLVNSVDELVKLGGTKIKLVLN